MAISLPARLETDRLVLRRYELSDVRYLDGDTIRSIDHIGAFLPNARAELLGDRQALLAGAIADFNSGQRFAYGVFLRDGAYVGNCGTQWCGRASSTSGIGCYWSISGRVT